MMTLTKTLVATVAAGAMAVSSAAPAFARDGHNEGGVSAGDMIAGALVIGGIAAVAASASHNDRSGYGYDHDDGRWGRGDYGRGYGFDSGNPRQAIAQCVNAAERGASRYSNGRADVTDVRDVRSTRWGYEVRGRIAVNAMGHDWRRGDGDYGRGWGGDYRGWNSSMRGYDSGSFTCKVERGRIVDLDYSGIRGL
ncbi:MAG: hypothetical protein KGL44_05860 [Sphingomonadales bacterium]|nr:hypothetical protein [Sphingomonadales bacterium]